VESQIRERLTEEWGFLGDRNSTKYLFCGVAKAPKAPF